MVEPPPSSRPSRSPCRMAPRRWARRAGRPPSRGRSGKAPIEIVAERGSRAFGVGLALSGARDDRTYRLSVPDVLITLGGTRAALNAAGAAALRATLDVGGLAVGDASGAGAFSAPPGT